MLKKISMYTVAVLLGAGLLAATQALSQEGKEPGMPDMDQMMKMYEQFNAMGPEHARFKEAVGTWNTVTKMWMGPGEPTISTGTSEMEVIFGGRYMVEHFKCTMMERPFEGMALGGFDKLKKKYVSIWLDNMSTGFMVMEGTYDEATKTTTSYGEYDDPFTGHEKMKSVLREVSKDKHVFEMYQIGPDGKENKTMEITYSRS
ncbi:MAG: DUF1579 domain-containing protein [Phycisphaerales bacterium]|nr:MAG: DUF1579 domain-containing protein [Phycisphaerales bacterium]